MSQHYSDTTREDDPHALPNVEVFYHDASNPYGGFDAASEEGIMPTGWYYWYCFPGCLPDSDPVGPFETEDAAVADARDS